MEEVYFARGQGDGETVELIMLTNLRTKKMSCKKALWRSIGVVWVLE